MFYFIHFVSSFSQWQAFGLSREKLHMHELRVNKLRRPRLYSQLYKRLLQAKIRHYSYQSFIANVWPYIYDDRHVFLLLS